jgi:membrane-bound ClpP family serine protease
VAASFIESPLTYSLTHHSHTHLVLPVILLLLLGLVLVLLEVFVPSGGVIGVLAVLSVMGSVVMAFTSGPATGMTFLLLALVALPGAFSFAIKIWPETPLGRRILIRIPTSQEVLPDSPHRRSLQELIGKVGRAKSLMLPSGAAEIAGHTVDAVSEGVTIEPGTLVRVVEVRGTRVVVRPAGQETPAAHAEDQLSRPIESLGLDPFRDPIA